MALPIKETPVLRGHDADRFVRSMCEAETKSAPREEYERARKVYDEMRKKEKERGFCP